MKLIRNLKSSTDGLAKPSQIILSKALSKTISFYDLDQTSILDETEPPHILLDAHKPTIRLNLFCEQIKHSCKFKSLMNKFIFRFKFF